MQVELSESTLEQLEQMVHEGAYNSMEEAVEAAVRHLAEDELTRKLERARQSIADGRGIPLTRELASAVIEQARAERSSARG